MSFSTILLVIFMVMFWLFRAVVALCTQFSIDLNGIVSYNLNFEIIISFITIVCIVLFAKRKLIGTLVYLLIYGSYYGEHLFTSIVSIVQTNAPLTIDVSMNLICDFIAVLLALFAVFDVAFEKTKKSSPKNKKTDWYFQNEKYDEELSKRDDREDKNQYKFY